MFNKAWDDRKYRDKDCNAGEFSKAGRDARYARGNYGRMLGDRLAGETYPAKLPGVIGDKMTGMTGENMPG
ncbi:hypothetical protein CJ030_MR5G009765 [Morella rubra]|uniref:Uncharacterized protein n=1 Tax=Morella rubra TaxID=262757 RepID=A0A6A1VJ54_9ROSI|nr:hypothetical protein CJ030_MR5G009765 [Morella rubra]